MLDLVGKRLAFFLLSAIIILAGLATHAVSPKLRLGIEFSSGALINVVFPETVTEDQLRATFAGLGHNEAVVQSTGEDEFLVRARASEDLDAQRETIQDALVTAYGEPEAFEFTAVSPVIAREALQAGGIAVLGAVAGILLYITWAFRSIPRAFRYGVAAVIALTHDVLIVVAVTAVAAQFMPLEISSMYLVGLLTVLGYSVNDSIVVFDRLRENILRGVIRDFSGVVNFSILETLGRSINTSFTTLLVLLALLFLGPATTRDFVLVLAVGVIAGSYSSIFIACQVLVSWETRSLGRLLGKSVTPGAPAVRY